MNLYCPDLTHKYLYVESLKSFRKAVPQYKYMALKIKKQQCLELMITFTSGGNFWMWHGYFYSKTEQRVISDKCQGRQFFRLSPFITISNTVQM
jgi:hypothetical protein